jgi:hypothetical protein
MNFYGIFLHAFTYGIVGFLKVKNMQKLKSLPGHFTAHLQTSLQGRPLKFTVKEPRNVLCSG